MITGEVQTWHHDRKGAITGTIVHDAPEWVVVKLVGEQRYGEPGSVVVLRKSLMTLVPEAAS